MKTTGIAFIYFLTGSAFILFQRHLPFLQVFLLKALIIPLLMFLFIINLKPITNKQFLLMIAALFFSWAGDIFLEVPSKMGEMFIPGLASFLIAHLMYIALFFSAPGENTVVRKRSYLFLPIIIAGVFLIYYLYDGLGVMRIPVILYAIVILTMLAGAVTRFGKVNPVSFLMVLAGAILFVVSDSGIAINKFNHHFRGASVFIMGTYIIAQFLIVMGYIRQFKKNYE